MTFEELNPGKPIMNALQDLEYVYPTPIQIQAFPVILSGRDVVGVAQTGTGKTFAYLMPMLKQLKYSQQKNPRILILVPTRELVLQVVEEIKKLTKYITVRIAGVYGGANINTQKQTVHEGLDILVATPGRLRDLALSGVLRLKSIQKLVIDEVDEMLNLGFLHQLNDILDLLPERRQNLLFSATLTEEVEELINEFFRNPEKIEIAPHGTPLDQIVQQAYHVPNFNTKVNLLEMLLFNKAQLTKVLVFVGSKRLADKLYEKMSVIYAEQVGIIHSNKSQNQRINSIKRFEEGTNWVLIATDIIARGLDIQNVTHVINFDTPKVPGDYIHRIGRTGRADKAGVAITLINEAEMEYQGEIENLMKMPIPILELPDGLVISDQYTPEERPSLYDKNYRKTTTLKNSQGAFHEKKDKNKKVNMGGSYKQKLKAKYKKPKTRSAKSKKKR